MKQLFLLPALFAFSLTAFGQPAKPAPKIDPAAAAAERDRAELEDRIRTQGATGGTRPIDEREKEGADVGAGPHRHFNMTPAPRDNEAPMVGEPGTQPAPNEVKK